MQWISANFCQLQIQQSFSTAVKFAPASSVKTRQNIKIQLTKLDKWFKWFNTEREVRVANCHGDQAPLQIKTNFTQQSASCTVCILHNWSAVVPTERCNMVWRSQIESVAEIHRSTRKKRITNYDCRLPIAVKEEADWNPVSFFPPGVIAVSSRLIS